MNMTRWMSTIACSTAFCAGMAFSAENNPAPAAAKPEAAEEEAAPEGWNWAMGEGLAYGEQSIASVEAGLAMHSKYLSYGFVDNNEPILKPSASVTFFDWAYVGVEAVFDLTKYGRKAYTNRAGRYIELDPNVGLAHSFSADDYEWLPTTVEVDLGYMYEYHPRSFCDADADTQFVYFEASLPDLWVEPTFLYERDIDRDNGTYLNLELGHTFELCDGLTFRPSVAQGFGNTQRMAGYVEDRNGEAMRHGGVMDTCIKGELAYELTDGVTLSGYVAYSDFLFDSRIRGGARRYEASGDWEESWNFIGGLSLAVCF